MPFRSYSDRRTILRCDRCGRVEVPSQTEILGYIRAQWPSCCGQVMNYLSEAERRENAKTEEPEK
jgi:hypothetical protein